MGAAVTTVEGYVALLNYLKLTVVSAWLSFRFVSRLNCGINKPTCYYDNSTVLIQYLYRVPILYAACSGLKNTRILVF